MKFFLLIVILCLFSAALIARDLTGVADRERFRRQAALAGRQGKSVRIYTNTDLERYRTAEPLPRPLFPGSTSAIQPPRDLAKERALWQKEKQKHQQELARIDARIRRLEWRLADRQARKRVGERFRDDPAERALEESLNSMRAERLRFVEEFLERGRKAGAFPGWLR